MTTPMNALLAPDGPVVQRQTSKPTVAFMQDDVLLNKAATIERCVARAREEYQHDPGDFLRDFTRQDAAIQDFLRYTEVLLIRDGAGA